MRKRGFTAVELITVLAVLTLFVSITSVMVSRSRQAMLRVESAQNLKDLHAMLYGPWPKLSPAPGHLTPRVPEAAMAEPEKFNAFISPAHPDAWRMRYKSLTNPSSAISDDSYFYLGYLLPNEDAGLAFIDAYRKSIERTGAPPTDFFLKVRPFDTRTCDGRTELTKLIRTSGPTIAAPVLIERTGLLRGGSTVLFTDGHIEFMKYPGKFPMTKKFIAALESLDDLKAKK